MEQQSKGRTAGETAESTIEKMRQKVLFVSGEAKNTDEIDLGSDGEGDGESKTNITIGQKMIPDEIYGGLKK